MLSFFCSVPSSSLVNRLLHHHMPLWLLLFTVSVPREELVQFVDRPIVGSNAKVSDPPAQRWYRTGTVYIREKYDFLTDIHLGVLNVRRLPCRESNSNLPLGT
jgi:hypothetical protein